MTWVHTLWNWCLETVFPSSVQEAAARGARYDDLASLYRPVAIKNVANATALFPYREPLIRQAIWELKYRGNKQLARLFAKALADWLLEASDEELPDARPTIFVPMPTTRARVRERGFNQTELVADLLYKEYSLPYIYAPDLLVRSDAAPSQTKAPSKASRLDSFKGVFEVHGAKRYSGARIILFDDVITTGATFERARQALRDAGFSEVEGLALGH